MTAATGELANSAAEMQAKRLPTAAGDTPERAMVCTPKGSSEPARDWLEVGCRARDSNKAGGTGGEAG